MVVVPNAPLVTTLDLVEALADAVVELQVKQMVTNMRGVGFWFGWWRRRHVSMLGDIELRRAIERIADVQIAHPKGVLLLAGLQSLIIVTQQRANNTVATFRPAVAGLPPKITLRFSKKSLTSFAEFFEAGKLDDIPPTMKVLMPHTRANLVHELTHACDHILSNGKYNSNARSRASKNTKGNHGREEFFKVYYRDPCEISAFIAEALASSHSIVSDVDVHDFVKIVCEALAPWSYLRQRERRAVIRRATKYWAAHQPPKRAKSAD